MTSREKRVDKFYSLWYTLDSKRKGVKMEEKYLLTAVTCQDLGGATNEELENFIQENYSEEETVPFMMWLDSAQKKIMSGDQATLKQFRMFSFYAADQALLS